MVATATTEASDQVAIDQDRILWDAEYRREVILRLKRLELEKSRSRGMDKPSQPQQAA
jgi:hypothetical protein